MKTRFRGLNLVRTLGMGLTIQTLLSSANFAVGLILIRRTSDLQYSYYILATNALLLVTALQSSFIQPYIVRNIALLDSAGRFELVGALVRANSRWVPILCGMGVLVTAGAWALQRITVEETLLVLIALLAAAMSLSREFFRITLFAHRQPAAVLQADVLYVVVLIAGVYLATLTPQPALAAVACVATAALLGFALLRRELWKFEPWNPRSGEMVLQKIAAAGSWAVLGSGIHWLLIQGYSYLVAGVLGVSDIAALAATRLSLMPVFVLSGGVSMLLFPLTTRWVHDMGTRVAARRLMLLAGVLGAVALLYMVSMWVLRDWIFDVVLKKHFAHRDSLIVLWSAVFLVTLCRDQLATLPAARARFRDMTLMTGVSAVAWLVSSYLAMLKYGPPGAVIGILIGELVNMAGILVMIFKDTRHPGVAATTC